MGRPVTVACILRLAASSAAGAAAALVAIVSLGWSATPQATPLPRPKLSLRENKRPLSQADLAAAAAWARRFRSCAAARNLILTEPTIGENEVVITGPAGQRITAAQSQKAFACGVKVGDPPPSLTFALLASDRQLHLYKPRACLLPAVEEPPA